MASTLRKRRMLRGRLCCLAATLGAGVGCSDSAGIAAVPPADLQVTLAGSLSGSTGDTVSAIITVVNTGPSDAQAVSVSLVIPDQVAATVTSAEASSRQNGKIVWALGPLLLNETRQLGVDIVIPAVATTTISASSSSSTPDPIMSNNDGSAPNARTSVLNTTDPQTLRCTQDFGDPVTSAYILPFPSGRSYRVNQTYCPPNPQWGHYGWLAYDFEMAIGSQVIASRPGTVWFVEERWPDSDRVCGHENIVWVRHADGTIMNYVHLTTNGALVQVGDQLSQGELIGLSGDSGCSSGPHLHVTLYRNGTSFGKENTLPFNYSNAIGPLDVRRGLLQNQYYQAR